jgi:hypothetical protein
MTLKSVAMSAGTIGIVSAVFGLVITAVVLSCVLPRMFSTLRSETPIKNGYAADAEVLEIGQTGVLLNQVPQMRMVVRADEGGASRQFAFRQFIDLGNIPRVGERVRILIDREDEHRAVYLGLAEARPQTH